MNREAIYKFVSKWRKIFEQAKEKIDYDALASDCKDHGFDSNVKDEFIEAYGDAFSNREELRKILHTIDDVELLASCIYSRIVDTELKLDDLWFYRALVRLSVLVGSNLLPFKGTASQLLLKTYYDANINDGQLLCIDRIGQVELFHNISQDGVLLCEEDSLISSSDANDILTKVSNFFRKAYTEDFDKNKEHWELELVNSSGVSYLFRGNASDNLLLDNCSLSNYIRAHLNFDELLLFDDNPSEEPIDSIRVQYTRNVFIEDKDNPDKGYFSKYLEFLTVNSLSDTLDYVLITENTGQVQHKIKMDGMGDYVFGQFDSRTIFCLVDGNPPDSIGDSNDTSNYTITIDFASGKQRVINGSFNKKALPRDWPKFASIISSALNFFNNPNILNPDYYMASIRGEMEYIYCSLIFNNFDESCYYITNDEDIKIGQYVLAPAGPKNMPTLANVVNVEYFTADDAPIPVDKTKRIIRKVTKEEIKAFYEG